MNTLKATGLVSFLILTFGVAHADSTLLEYSFTGQSVTPTATADYLAGSAFSAADEGASFSISNESPLSGGYDGATRSYYLNSNHWSSSSSNSLQFTVTPDPGYAVTLSALSFGYLSSGSGPVTYSITVGETTFDGSLVRDTAWHQVILSFPTEALYFDAATLIDVAFGGASSAGGTVHLDDFTLTGTLQSTSPIPEASACALLVGLGALTLVIAHPARVRRRRNPASPEARS